MADIGIYKAINVKFDDSDGVFSSTNIEDALTEERQHSSLINSDDIFDCNSGVVVNDFVYLDNSSILQKSDNTDSSKLPLFGVVRGKPTSTTCQIQLIGDRTGFTGLTVGKVYYLGTNGGVTITPPTTADTVIVPIGVVKNSTTIMVLINNRQIINT